MAEYLLPLEQMIEQLGKLPGVGRKTAAKYAFRLLAMPEEELEECTGMQEYFDTVKRPMGDLVLCHAPEEIPYDIELTYHIALSNVKNASTIQENVEAAVKEYETWQRKIGRDIEPAELIMRVREAGAKRPRLLTPVETTVSEIQVAKLRSCKVTYGGIEDD